MALITIALYPLAYVTAPETVGELQARIDLARGRIQLVDLEPPRLRKTTHHSYFRFFHRSRWGWEDKCPEVPVVHVAETWPTCAALSYAQGYNRVMARHLEIDEGADWNDDEEQQTEDNEGADA